MSSRSSKSLSVSNLSEGVGGEGFSEFNCVRLESWCVRFFLDFLNTKVCSQGVDHPAPYPYRNVLQNV